MERHPETVAAAAVYLDNDQPGWASRINLKTLDLTNSSSCVIAQTTGDFWKWYNARFKTSDLSGSPFGNPGGIRTEALYHQWVYEINKRVRQESPAPSKSYYILAIRKRPRIHGPNMLNTVHETVYTSLEAAQEKAAECAINNQNHKYVVVQSVGEYAPVTPTWVAHKGV